MLARNLYYSLVYWAALFLVSCLCTRIGPARDSYQLHTAGTVPDGGLDVPLVFDAFVLREATLSGNNGSAQGRF
jgi:hypothetical protein